MMVNIDEQDIILNDNKSINNNNNNNAKKLRTTFPFYKCRVCKDKATGFHYGIETCEGCKGFFKRSTLKKEKYRCYFGNKCELRADNRNRCKACRYRICLEVGMSLDSVKMGRIPKEFRERILKNRSIAHEEILSIDDSEQVEMDNHINKTNTNTQLNHVSKFISKTLSTCIQNISLNDNTFINTPQSLLSDSSTHELDHHTYYSQHNTHVKALSIINTNDSDDHSNAHPHLNNNNNNNDDDEVLIEREINTSILLNDNNQLHNNYTLITIGNFLYTIHVKDMRNVNALVNRAQAINKLNYKRESTLNISSSSSSSGGGGNINNNCQLTTKISLNDIWSGLIKEIECNIKLLIDLCKLVPFLSDSLDSCDFMRFIDTRLFDFFMLRNSSLAIDNEFYLLLNNNQLPYTKENMIRAVGIEITNEMFNFFNSFNLFKLTDKEMSILIPFLLTSSNHLNSLSNLNKLLRIHELLGRCLVYEFYLNKRTSLFVNKLNKVCNLLPKIHQLEIDYVRSINLPIQAQQSLP